MLTEKQLSGVLDIIAQEIGVSTDEVYDADDFADLGLDAVLSNSIIGQVKEKLNLDLPAHIFQDNVTAAEVRSFLELQYGSKEQHVHGEGSIHVGSNGTSHRAPTPCKARPAKNKAPLSIALQGWPSDNQRTIFLLPDGSGSAMVYSQFPHISDSACVVAFNSPFLIDYDGSSISFNTSIEDLCLIWVEEIKRRQPHGPYIIGGYSAGGYYTFEVAKELRRQGDIVEKLVLIDSPCRVEFGAPQMEAIQFLSEQNLLGDWGAAKKPPDWFVKHFQGTIEAVEKYMPTAMGGKCSGSFLEMPEVFVIWATKGILEDLDIKPEDTGLDMNVSVTRFMLEGKKKMGFGLHGWDRILPGAKIWEAKVPGNHFTLVHRPNVRLLESIRQSWYETFMTTCSLIQSIV